MVVSLDMMFLSWLHSHWADSTSAQVERLYLYCGLCVLIVSFRYDVSVMTLLIIKPCLYILSKIITETSYIYLKFTTHTIYIITTKLSLRKCNILVPTQALLHCLILCTCPQVLYTLGYCVYTSGNPFLPVLQIQLCLHQSQNPLIVQC